MTLKNRLMSAAAHFTGIGMGLPVKGSKSDPEKPNPDEDDEAPGANNADDEDAKKKAEKDKRRRARNKKAGRAEDDDGDERDEDEEDEDEVGAKKKGRRAGDDEDGDQDDEEREHETEEDEEARKASLIADPAHRQAAMLQVLRGARAGARERGMAAERYRCAAIFAHPSAVKATGFAASLAFNTSLKVDEAHRLLATAPAASRLGERMQGVNQPRTGAGGGNDPTSGAAIAASWDKVLKA
jgi:hypothetical protein